MKKNSFKILLSVLLKTDYRDKEHNTKKKLFGILLAYLVSNTFLSYTYSLIFDETSFIVMSITASMFMISFIVLNDFDNLFLANKSINILSSLPLNNAEIFSAKFTSGFFYLLFFFVALAIPQVIFFTLFSPALSKILLFILINFLFSFTIAGILLLFYILTLFKFTKKAGIIIILIQFLFFLFVIFTVTLPSASIGITEAGLKRNILDYSFMIFSAQNLYVSAIDNILSIFLILLIFIGVYIFIYNFVSKNYQTLLNKVNLIKKDSSAKSQLSSSGRRKFSFNIFAKIGEGIFRNNNESFAAYKLTKWQISNSKFLRLKYIPLTFLPLIFAAIGFVLDIPGLLIFRDGYDSIVNSAILILSPTISLTLIMSSRLLISNTKILDEHSMNTKWIYESLPVNSAKSIVNGTNGYIFINYILPLILFIFILLIIKTGILTAMVNILYISSAIVFINSIFSIFNKDLPFTLESNKFNSAFKMIEIIISITAGVIIFMIQFFIFQNIIFVLLVSFLFIAVSYILNIRQFEFR